MKRPISRLNKKGNLGVAFVLWFVVYSGGEHQSSIRFLSTYRKSTKKQAQERKESSKGP